MDLKSKRILAALLHSRVMVAKAPNYVVAAMVQWIEELDRAEGENTTNGFTDEVTVSDHVETKITEVN